MYNLLPFVNPPQDFVDISPHEISSGVDALKPPKVASSLPSIVEDFMLSLNFGAFSIDYQDLIHFKRYTYWRKESGATILSVPIFARLNFSHRNYVGWGWGRGHFNLRSGIFLSFFPSFLSFFFL